MRDNRIRPSYQPKVCLTDGSIVGLSAAALALPDQRRAAAGNGKRAFNDYELATKISEAMQLKVFADIARWRAAGVAVRPISLNVSPIEFTRQLRRNLPAAPAEVPHSPTLIELEVTEHARSTSTARSTLLRAANAQGDGHPHRAGRFRHRPLSFSHIMDYPLDCIAGLRLRSTDEYRTGDPGDRGKHWHPRPKLSIDIIAEGGKTEQQRQTLCEAGFHIGQGYFVQPGCGIPAGPELLQAMPQLVDG